MSAPCLRLPTDPTPNPMPHVTLISVLHTYFSMFYHVIPMFYQGILSISIAYIRKKDLEFSNVNIYYSDLTVV